MSEKILMSFEDLKKKYPGIVNTQLYGECIVVPGTEFNPDWEVSLADEGHNCFNTDFEKRLVTLVQVEKKLEGAAEIKEVYSPQKEPSIPRHKQFPKLWTKDEDARLLQEWPRASGNVDEKAKTLMSLFPGRTAIAIHIHYNNLLAKARSQPEKRHEDAKPRTTREIAKKARDRKYKDVWTAEEDVLLIELHKKKLPYWELAEQFREKYPNRTDGAIFYRIGPLLKEGKIKPRFQRRKQKPGREKVSNGPNVDNVDNVAKREKVEKKEQAKKTEELPTVLPAEESIPPSIPTHAPVTKDPVVKLLEEIRDLLAPASYSFEYFCRNCGERGNVCSSESVYEFCPVCGKPLIIWNVEAEE